MRSGQFLTSWMIQLLDEQKLYGIYCSLLSFLNSFCIPDRTQVESTFYRKLLDTQRWPGSHPPPEPKSRNQNDEYHDEPLDLPLKTFHWDHILEAAELNYCWQ